MASFQFHSSVKKLTYTSKFPTKPERLGQLMWKVTGFRPQERRFLRRPQLAHHQKAAELKGPCGISGETPGDPDIGSAPALLTSWVPSTETETVVPMTLAMGSKSCHLQRYKLSQILLEMQTPGPHLGQCLWISILTQIPGDSHAH